MLSALMPFPESSVTALAARPYTGRRTFLAANRHLSIRIMANVSLTAQTGGVSLKSHANLRAGAMSDPKPWHQVGGT